MCSSDLDSTSVEYSLDLTRKDVTVHLLGHDCGPDKSVQVSDWTATGADLERLADDFDQDYSQYLAPIAGNDPYFASDSDLAALGLGDRFATTCTDVGAVWTDGTGPSLWIPGVSSERLLPDSRPLAEEVWARALVVTADGLTLFVYAGYAP